MSYKPKFCCECGEKVERDDWKLWYSRRFCRVCEAEFGLSELLKRVSLAALIVFGTYGFGLYLFKSDAKTAQSAPNHLISSTTQNSIKTDTAQKSEQQKPQANTDVQALSQPTVSSSIKQETKQNEIKNVDTIVRETVYFCGAETKKGTPCSRRVKGGGRCWQHTGQKAMLPDEKLIASSN